MFSKTIDSKLTTTDKNGVEYVDLGSSIFSKKISFSQLYSVYKVPEMFNMRPDLISRSLYGTEDYTEMMMKYSYIDNPFTVEKNDLIYSITLSSIYTPVVDLVKEQENTLDLVKNYHKYIDPSKKPNITGSESSKFSDDYTNYGDVEPNISKTGDTGITVKDGRIYFGNINNKSSAADAASYNVSPGIGLSEGKVFFGLGNYTGNASDGITPNITEINSNGATITFVTDSDDSGSGTGTSGSGNGSGSGTGTSGTEAGDGNNTGEGNTVASFSPKTFTKINTKNGNIITSKTNSDGVTQTIIENPIKGTVSIIDSKLTKLPNGELVDENGKTSDSDIVNCAENGVSLGEFLNATIANSIK